MYMTELKIYVEVYCKQCGSEDILITDCDENTYFCKCKSCGKRFEKMRT